MDISFTELYQQLHTKVFNLVLNYLQNIEEAEEVTADVFVEVYQKIETFRGESSPQTWVYRIAVNKSLDFIRYKNRRKRKGFIVSLFGAKDDDKSALNLPDFRHPGVATEEKERSRILYAAINQLQDNQRTAFILVYIEELPQREAGQIMKVSVKAVESLLQRAKAQLRKRLEMEFERRNRKK